MSDGHFAAGHPSSGELAEYRRTPKEQLILVGAPPSQAFTLSGRYLLARGVTLCGAGYGRTGFHSIFTSSHYLQLALIDPARIERDFVGRTRERSEQSAIERSEQPEPHGELPAASTAYGSLTDKPCRINRVC
jgi:hypothetical protein